MKALLCRKHGKPDSLILENIPSLEAEPGKVIIQVKACSVNFPDTLIIQNLYQFKPELPFSPGGEVSGVVKKIGEGVKGLKVGDRVFALTGWGGMAEEVSVESGRVFPMLPEMDFVTAASVMYNYGTSFHALKDRALLQSGETLLVLGAAGGVGLAAVELGKLMGAKVIAAASSDEKLAICSQKGADFVVNYSQEDLKETLKKITNGNGVDVIYDAVGDKYTEPALRSIAWKGRYLVVGFAGGEIPKIPLNLALLKGCSIMGVFWGQFSAKEPQQNFQNLQTLANFFQKGQLRPHIHRLYPLEEAADAIDDLMNRKVIGKAVVVMTDEAMMPTEFAEAIPEKVEENTKNEVLVIKNAGDLSQFIGQALGTSDWVVLSQEMINDFANATSDHQWIHTDSEKAKFSPFGSTIAHGFLSLSLMPHLMSKIFMIESVKMGVNYGTNKVRFITPVPSGSKVRLKVKLIEAERGENNSIKLVLEATLELQNASKPACVAELLTILYE